MANGANRTPQRSRCTFNIKDILELKDAASMGNSSSEGKTDGSSPCCVSENDDRSTQSTSTSTNQTQSPHEFGIVTNSASKLPFTALFNSTYIIVL